MTPLAAPAPAPSSLLTRLAVGISIAVHVCAVMLSLGYAGAGLFASSEAEAVQVSLVTPDELPPEPDKTKSDQNKPDQNKPEPDLSQLDLRLTPSEPKNEPAQQAAGQPSVQPVSASQAAPASAQTSNQPQPQASSTPTQPPQPAYIPPQPDISMRYQVDLGLKMLPPAPTQTASAQNGTSDFDAPAMKNAEIERSSIAAFRARLKQCAALPAEIAPDDKVVIVLRATFTPDARLAANPVLIEASASAKGPALMQAAVNALQKCQPHDALPAKDYAEWRVLDLRFTPQDFKRS